MRKRLLIATRMGSGLVVDEGTELSRGANDNVIATDIRRRGEKITRIVNIYNQNDGELGERDRLARKLNWQRVIWRGSTVLTGDFNAHSKQCHPRCRVVWNTTFGEGTFDKNGQEIGND
jgi:hypothetical protein